MTLRTGDPISLSGVIDDGIFKVGVTNYNSDGKTFSASGTITVEVPNPADYSRADLLKQARSIALQMVAADPSLLTPVGHTGGGRDHTVRQIIGDKTPWSDGESKHVADQGSKGPSGILSPDTGQVNL